MNTLTKRVPREPSEEQRRALRKLIEDFGYELSPGLVQLVESAYSTGVSSAPIDPLEVEIENIAIARLRGAA